MDRLHLYETLVPHLIAAGATASASEGSIDIGPHKVKSPRLVVNGVDISHMVLPGERRVRRDLTNHKIAPTIEVVKLDARPSILVGDYDKEDEGFDWPKVVAKVIDTAIQVIAQKKADAALRENVEGSRNLVRALIAELDLNHGESEFLLTNSKTDATKVRVMFQINEEMTAEEARDLYARLKAAGFS